MRWIRDRDLSTFAARVTPWLLDDPIVNNVPYTLTRMRLDGVVATEPDAVWLHAEDDSGNVTGAALRTPPRELLLANIRTTDAQALAELLIRDAKPTPGVGGPAAPAKAFTRRYTALSGGTAEVERTSRIYRLDAVTPPAGVPGALRAATLDDLDLMLAWRRGFAADVAASHGGAGEPVIRSETTNRIEAGDMVWLWEHSGRPVATAWLSPATAGVSRVSMVYTPPELRCHGYASACVAAVSQLALDNGAHATMLYADLANPLTNRLYQRIGYRAVCDTTQWWFVS